MTETKQELMDQKGRWNDFPGIHVIPKRERAGAAVK
jgi:hypothetical protein